MKKHHLITLLLVASVLFLGNTCGDECYEPPEEVPIETLSLAVRPQPLSAGGSCAVVLSGTIDECYKDAAATFTLYKDIDGSYERIHLYLKDASLTDWTDVSCISYPIRSEDYAAVTQTFTLLVTAKGDYHLQVSVRATDSQKENTEGVYTKTIAFSVGA